MRSGDGALMQAVTDCGAGRRKPLHGCTNQGVWGGAADSLHFPDTSGKSIIFQAKSTFWGQNPEDKNKK